MWSNPWLPPLMKVLPRSQGRSYTGLLLSPPFTSRHAPSLLVFFTDPGGGRFGTLIWSTNVGIPQEHCCIYGLVMCSLCEDMFAVQTLPQDKFPRFLPAQPGPYPPLSFCWLEFCTPCCFTECKTLSIVRCAIISCNKWFFKLPIKIRHNVLSLKFYAC